MAHDLGILLIRVIIGLGIAAHGAQKLFGWFGGHGPKGTGGFMESLGFQPGVAFAVMSGSGEFFGGLLILLGLLGPIGPALVISVLTVAILTVHIRNGFFAANNGFEIPLIYIAGALAVAFTSSSLLTLDNLFGITLFHSAAATWVFVALGLVAGLLAVLTRRAPAQSSASA
jgi:putative oxidoreductase